MFNFLLKLYVLHQLETQVDGDTFTWNIAGRSRRHGTHRPPRKASVYKPRRSLLPFFQLDRARYLATPEFKVVRRLILLQGEITKGQRPRLTSTGRMRNPP